MLKVIDSGCNKHDWSQLTLFGSEAELMRDIIDNLPRVGGFHTFICDEGHTHQLRFQVKTGNFVSEYS